MKLKKVALPFLTAVFFGGLTTPGMAFDLFPTDPEDYIKTRTYIGALGTSSNISDDGDFNGTLWFEKAYPPFTETSLIPALSRNFGFGGLVGHRQGAYAMEISYWRSEHESTWGPSPYPSPPLLTAVNGIVYYQSINVDLKRYLFTKLPTQPFFTLGLSFPWLEFKEASTLDVTEFTDASYSGLGFNLGIGLEIYMQSDISFFGQVQHRWSGFSQLAGASRQVGNASITGSTATNFNLVGDGLNFIVGATAGFE